MSAAVGWRCVGIVERQALRPCAAEAHGTLLAPWLPELCPFSRVESECLNV